MKTLSLLKSSLLGALIGFCSPFQAQAQLEVRMSIKVILDANGVRPAGGQLSTDAGIQLAVLVANRLLASFGRGFQFQITEILDLPGHSELLDLACQDASDAIDAGVATNSVSYQWRVNAVNVYINRNSDETGSCAFNSLLVLKYTTGSGTFLHEGGHHLGLAHTHGGGCTSCEDCPQIVSDNIADTLPDRVCWTQDQIATNAFHQVFADLTPAQQMMVSNTFNNVMSYHRQNGGTATVYTPDQWDRVADFTRTDRANVMNGKTVFVDRANTCAVPAGNSACVGGFTGPFPTVTRGISGANSGDIVLIRPGHYNEPLTLTKAVTFRATRGDAVIGKP